MKEPFVYYDAGMNFNGVRHLQLMESSLDAIVLAANCSFQVAGDNSILPFISSMNNSGKPVILQPKERIFSEHVLEAVSAGAISLGYNCDSPEVLVESISKIMKASQSPVLAKTDIAKSLYRNPRSSDFWFSTSRTDYTLAFAEKGFLPSQELRNYADTISKGSSIIINCGHIDDGKMMPDAATIETFNEGVRLLRYLEHQGHENVGLSVLLNDMYEFNIDKAVARRNLDRRRREIRRTGVTDIFPQSYMSMLQMLGYDIGTISRSVSTSLESAAKFSAFRFVQEVKGNLGDNGAISLLPGGAYGYDCKIGNVGKDVVEIASENGAPLCRLIAGTYFSGIEKKGATHIIHLYDMQHSCSTIGGIDTAKTLFGSKTKHKLFLYTKEGQNIKHYEMQVA